MCAATGSVAGMSFIDCSHALEDGMVTYPGLPGPRITDHMTRQQSRAHYAEGTEFHIGRIDMVANTGTYLDTPAHRYVNGFDLAGLPLDRVANLPGVCIRTDRREITMDALSGAHVSGCAVLLATGWDRHWRTDRYGDPDHPFLAESAVELLVERGARLVGIDSVNIDATTGGERPAHSGLLAAGIPVVEHLTGLDPLVGVDFRFFAVPVKVSGMGTFPVRAFAVTG